MSVSTKLVLFVLLISFSSYEVMRWWQNNWNKLPVYGMQETGNKIPVEPSIETFQLTNQDSSSSGTDSWKGKIVIVNFFFTHCAGICPRMTSNLKRVREAYHEDNDVLISSLTVDPERDSVSQLLLYARSFGINTNQWQLLTGNKKDIYRLARNEFRIVAADGDGGPNDFIHSEKFVLVDPQKRIRGYYKGTVSEEVDQLIQDIKKLKNEN